jgi:hypothetical protein
MKEGKKVPGAVKAKMEEALGLRFRGVQGLAGKEHTATGPRFLHVLIKAKKDGSFEMPPWEERCP